MSKPAFYNGILYQIEYQPQLSNNGYYPHEDENYPHEDMNHIYGI